MATLQIAADPTPAAAPRTRGRGLFFHRGVRDAAGELHKRAAHSEPAFEVESCHEVRAIGLGENV